MQFLLVRWMSSNLDVIRSRKPHTAVSSESGSRPPSPIWGYRPTSRTWTTNATQAHGIGEKPVSAVLVDSVQVPRLDDLESRRPRHGYNARVLALAHELNIRQAEVRSFLRGTLPPGRTEEIQKQLRPRGFWHDIPPHRGRTGDQRRCSFSSTTSKSVGWPSCS